MTAQSGDIGDLTRKAQEALARGEAERAQALLQDVVTSGRADAAVWLTVAHAAVLQDDMDAKIAAIDKALALAPRDVRALIAKADHLAMQGDRRAAATFYATALQLAPPPDQTPPRLREALQRARTANEGVVRDLEDFVRARLEGGALVDAPSRFSRAVDILFNRKRAYVQQPRYLYYPELPNVQFYERDEFRWLDRVEAATETIRAELSGLIGPQFTPYVTQTPGRPRNDQGGLADNPDWSALFLFKDGVEQPAAKQCCKTIEALVDAPLTHIPNRTPSILFSKLAAGAHIPPHTGMLNTRLICHLPLIVPDDCAFRVGNDERPWVEGRAWAFDDTIEHEAWNRSAQDRYILIFDVWRPELSTEERQCVSALCQAIDAYGAGVSWDG
jgi:aspartyl/asparaginyl beta-hydroxylase (cupin superfamily)